MCFNGQHVLKVPVSISWTIIDYSKVTNVDTTSKSYIPPSILVKIVLVHFRNTSSTFSPVSALVSRKDSSVLETHKKV